MIRTLTPNHGKIQLGIHTLILKTHGEILIQAIGKTPMTGTTPMTKTTPMTGMTLITGELLKLSQLLTHGMMTRMVVTNGGELKLEAAAHLPPHLQALHQAHHQAALQAHPQAAARRQAAHLQAHHQAQAPLQAHQAQRNETSTSEVERLVILLKSEGLDHSHSEN